MTVSEVMEGMTKACGEERGREEGERELTVVATRIMN
jgi:hypothetical protein